MAKVNEYESCAESLLNELQSNGGSVNAASIKLKIDRRSARRWRDRLIDEGRYQKAGVARAIKAQLGKKKATWTKSVKHMVIPDVQVKPGQDFTFLRHVGAYIVEKQPDVIIQIGDWCDFESLSSYDKGKKSSWGKAYKKDLEAHHQAMRALLGPLREYNKRQLELGLPIYRPRMVFTKGNHEHRCERIVEENPEFDGLVSSDDLDMESYGWEVYPFLEVVNIHGVCYSHYFTSGAMGRPVSSAAALVKKKHQSCVMGHVQSDQIWTETRADGKRLTGLFVGCCNEHDEPYLGLQGNDYWRGIWMLHEVEDGSFEPMQVSLKHLRKRYEQ